MFMKDDGKEESKEKKRVWARLSEMYPQKSVCLFKNEKTSISLDNLSPHNSVNKAWLQPSQLGSAYQNAIRLMIQTGHEQLLRSMFVFDSDSGSSY